jgi:hypothetical protein
MSKLNVDTGEVVALVTKQLIVNNNIIADLEYLLTQAKEGRINAIQLLAYSPAQDERWFAKRHYTDNVTVTDCFVFTETLHRQVCAWRNIADDIIDSLEDS